MQICRAFVNSLGRQRGRPLAARIRPGDRARQSQHLQPRPEPPEIQSQVAPDDARRRWRGATMSCRVCERSTGGGVLRIVRCAAVRRRGDGRAACAWSVCGGPRGAGAAALCGEFSFPASCRIARARHFGSAWQYCFLVLIALALLRLQAPMIAVCALGLPLMFVLYLYEIDVQPRSDHSFTGTYRVAGCRARCRVGAADRPLWSPTSTMCHSMTRRSRRQRFLSGSRFLSAAQSSCSFPRWR